MEPRIDEEERYKALWEEMKTIVEKLKANYNPERVILFGSLVEGRIDAGSDIDMIIIKETTKDPWTRASEVDHFIEHKLPVDVLVYTPQEIEDRLKINDCFIKEVMEKGKVVYER